MKNSLDTQAELSILENDINWRDKRYHFWTVENCPLCKHFRCHTRIGGSQMERCEARPLAMIRYNCGYDPACLTDGNCKGYTYSKWNAFKQWVWDHLPL